MVLVSHDVARAVSICIASTSYQPPPLPRFDESDWERFLPNDSPVESAALIRDVLSTKGKGILDFALLSLLEDYLDGKPPGMLSIIKEAVSSEAVLKNIMLKIDARLLANNAKKVETGFCLIVAHTRDRVGRNLSWILEWLDTIFGPPIKAAAVAYTAELAHARVTRPGNEARRAKREAADTVFLHNFRQTHNPDSDSDASDSEGSFQIETPPSPVIPPFDALANDLSPLNPDVLKRVVSTSGSRSGPETPVEDPYRDFVVWAEMPSPSGIEAELALPYEHLNSIANRAVSVTQTLTRLGVEGGSETPSGAGLLPALELTHGGTATASSTESVGDDTLPELNLSDILNLPKDSDTSLESGKSSCTLADDFRRPLTPRN
ncbi:hypothetical protein DFH09DRAFT_1369794 [Mycena vulgaris]|nr:hypothetical protein DFH09DRAFT_1369794 [Mycena vulgaris]